MGDRSVTAVLFDFSGTLLAVRDPQEWVRHAAEAVGVEIPADALPAWTERFQAAGRPGGPEPVGTTPDEDAAYAGRDLSPAHHRAAYLRIMRRAADPSAPLPAAPVPPAELPVTEALLVELYESNQRPEGWVPYPDAEPVLAGLRARGVPVAIVSNISHDLRGTFAAHGLDGYVDAWIFSYELDVMKPAPVIFRAACSALDVAPEQALMVGDSTADGGGAAIGIRTLLLPASPAGAVHGLDAVLHLVDGT